MNKEIISDKQGIALVILFTLGTSTLILTGLEAKKDLWLAIILSIVMALPMILIYARLHYTFPEKTFFDVLEICFGKFIGKGIGLLYVWFAFHLSSLVLLNYSEFFVTVTLPETPKIAPVTLIIILSVWIVKEGIEVVGRFAEFFIPIIISFMFIAILLLIPKMDINNIRPVLYNGINPVIKGAFSVFSFPFTETVIIIMVFSTLKRKKSSYKVYTLGLLISGKVIFLLWLTVILVLGVDTASSIYFPTYNTFARLDIKDFLQRLEIISAIVFVIAGFVKFSICLLATCKGITKIFGYTDYRFIVTPVALLVINLSSFLHESIMDWHEWSSEVSLYYEFPFQVILPIIILIAAEIKKKQFVIN